ncbi:MAG: nuclear transport factor 2 family protein [Dehalococcoidales bacterium]
MTTADLESKIKSLEKKLKAQEKKLTLLEDIEAIKRLQKAYNYYVEHMLGEAIIDCFADRDDVMLDWLEGKWTGKEGVRKYFGNMREGKGPKGLSHQLMPSGGLITVAKNGKTAQGRWYGFGAIFMSDKGNVKGGSLTGGIYEMGYVKERGIWKILSINWIIPYGVRIPSGWTMPEDLGRGFITGRGAVPQEGGGQAPPPMPKADIPLDPKDLRYVSGYIFPFHFMHPVTGKPTNEASRNAGLKPVSLD